MRPVSRRIAGFELRLPDDWHEVPDGVPDVVGWARSTAAGLVEAAGADGLVAVQTADATDVLAEQLADVAAAVQGTGIAALRTAVLVRNPERGVVDAMITLVAQQGLSVQEFTHQLAEIVAAATEPEPVYAGQVTAAVDAGEVAGVHLVLGHGAQDDLGEGVAVLEERVVLGVFPPHTTDMVEVTAIARSVGSFDDMPQAMIDVLAGLSIDSEPLS
jgi:hypothetical protein